MKKVNLDAQSPVVRTSIEQSRVSVDFRIRQQEINENLSRKAIGRESLDVQRSSVDGRKSLQKQGQKPIPPKPHLEEEVRRHIVFIDPHLFVL